MSRVSTPIPSPHTPLALGWWIVVCTHVLSLRSLRARGTGAGRASCAARSTNAGSVAGWMVAAQRSSVLLGGTRGTYPRQNQRKPSESATRCPVSA
jgi:hypothetical protein